jgi:hypothetical protein
MTDDIVIGGDAEDIPPGTYPAKLTALGDAESVAFGAFKTWDFTLDNGSRVGGASSLNSGRKSKLYRWASALGVKDGETLSTAIGHACLVVVGLNKDGWPTVENVLPPLAAQNGSGRPKKAEVAPVVTPTRTEAPGAPVVVEELPF